MTRYLTRRRFHATALSAITMTAGTLSLSRRAAAAADNLVLQTNWLNDPEFLGYMIGIDNGYFAAEGLSISYLSGGPNVLPEGSVITGKSDLGLTSTINTAHAIADRGAPLKIIGAQYQRVRLASSASPPPASTGRRTSLVRRSGSQRWARRNSRPC